MCVHACVHVRVGVGDLRVAAVIINIYYKQTRTRTTAVGFDQNIYMYIPYVRLVSSV